MTNAGANLNGFSQSNNHECQRSKQRVVRGQRFQLHDSGRRWLVVSIECGQLDMDEPVWLYDGAPLGSGVDHGRDRFWLREQLRGVAPVDLDVVGRPVVDRAELRQLSASAAGFS